MFEDLDAPLSRRRVIRWTGAAGMLGVAAVVVDACTMAPPSPTTTSVPTTGTSSTTTTTTTVPLEVDPNGLLLMPGFTSRVVANGGQEVASTGLTYRWYPDGATTFPDLEVPGGWYLVENHEIAGTGGVTSIRFAPDGSITGAASVCADTYMNCAGGATPWGTWLSGEEYSGGKIWECDPTGAVPAQVRDGLGVFAHEGAAVAADGRVYMTEDKQGGGFYRFTPTTPGDLSDGLLEIATGPTRFGPVTWTEVPDPSAQTTATRLQVPSTLPFDGPEGIDASGNDVWFTSKGDRRVWHYRVDTQVLEVRYQTGDGPLNAVDNIWVDEASMALFIAEDGGNMELVMLRPDNSSQVVVRVPDQPDSEITGPCFNPAGDRLYFSSQRAPVGAGAAQVGTTFEITGPWDEFLGR